MPRAELLDSQSDAGRRISSMVKAQISSAVFLRTYPINVLTSKIAFVSDHLELLLLVLCVFTYIENPSQATEDLSFTVDPPTQISMRSIAGKRRFPKRTASA